MSNRSEIMLQMVGELRETIGEGNGKGRTSWSQQSIVRVARIRKLVTSWRSEGRWGCYLYRQSGNQATFALYCWVPSPKMLATTHGWLGSCPTHDFLFYFFNLFVSFEQFHCLHIPPEGLHLSGRRPKSRLAC